MIDRRFYRETANTHVLFADFSRRAYELSDLSPLAEALLEASDKALHMVVGAVFAHDAGAFELLEAHNLPGEQGKELRVDAASLESLQTGMAVTRHRRTYVLLVPVLVPDLGTNRLEAIIALGPRLSGQAYREEDKAFLSGLANQVSMALYVSRLKYLSQPRLSSA